MTPPPGDVRIVIAGGGFAALEAMLALADLGEGRANIELVAPHSHFTFKPMAVDESFGLEPFPEFDLTDLADQAGAVFRQDCVVSIDEDSHSVILDSGGPVQYDYLLMATGATPVVKLPGAFTFWPTWSHDEVGDVIDAAIRGDFEHLVFAIPDGPVWPLPAYELAVRTACRIADEDGSCRVSLVTPECPILRAFGADVGRHVTALLERWGVRVLSGLFPVVFWDGILSTESGESIQADQVVSLPGLEGPMLTGASPQANGFLACDEHGRVLGADHVFAAGDATSFPVKLGGIAMQQADAAAEAIAFDAWGRPNPEPFDPKVQGVLLTDEDAIRIGDRADGASILRARSLWNPLVKAPGKYLTSFLEDLYGPDLAASRVPVGKSIEIDLR